MLHRARVNALDRGGHFQRPQANAAFALLVGRGLALKVEVSLFTKEVCDLDLDLIHVTCHQAK